MKWWDEVVKSLRDDPQLSKFASGRETVRRECRTCGHVAEFPVSWKSPLTESSFNIMGSLDYLQSTTCSMCWSSDVECERASRFDDRPRRRRAIVRWSCSAIGDSRETDPSLADLDKASRVGHVVSRDDSEGRARFVMTTRGVPHSAVLLAYHHDKHDDEVRLLYEHPDFEVSAEPTQVLVELCELPIGARASA